MRSALADRRAILALTAAMPFARVLHGCKAIRSHHGTMALLGNTGFKTFIVS